MSKQPGAVMKPKERVTSWGLPGTRIVVVLACSALVLLAASCIGGAGGSRRDVFASRMQLGDQRPAEGTLTISYEIGEASGLQPSYQTVIWLEDANGRYLQSLFVSEYLSYCGTSYSTICPDWVQVAAWDEVPEAELDAVTCATPPVGRNTLRADCGEHCIPPGTYRYCVQTHITADYNIICRGEILIGEAESQSVAEASYKPEVHSRAQAVLGSVEARFQPE